MFRRCARRASTGAAHPSHSHHTAVIDTGSGVGRGTGTALSRLLSSKRPTGAVARILLFLLFLACHPRAATTAHIQTQTRHRLTVCQYNDVVGGPVGTLLGVRARDDKRQMASDRRVALVRTAPGEAECSVSHSHATLAQQAGYIAPCSRR
jgi:hypothetical protein